MTKYDARIVTGTALSLMMVVMSPMYLTAQDRMPPIPAGNMTDAQRKAVAEFKDARGADPDGPFVPLLRSPEVMIRARAMGDYLRFRSALPQKLSELVILMTARQWTQQFEWHLHSRIAMSAGLDREVVRAIAEGRRPEHMGEHEAILYDFCAELQQHHSVSDATYARAVSAFGEAGVIDTVGIVGYYSLLAMVMNTTRTPLPAGAAPALAAFPR